MRVQDIFAILLIVFTITLVSGYPKPLGQSGSIRNLQTELQQHSKNLGVFKYPNPYTSYSRTEEGRMVLELIQILKDMGK